MGQERENLEILIVAKPYSTEELSVAIDRALNLQQVAGERPGRLPAGRANSSERSLGTEEKFWVSL